MLILHLYLLLPRQELIQPRFCVRCEYLEKEILINWVSLIYFDKKLPKEYFLNEITCKLWKWRDSFLVSGATAVDDESALPFLSANAILNQSSFKG